jgi:3-hydroxyisobutyrate dehydrogenase-like beta-hydroxyacid dehydrogenase
MVNLKAGFIGIGNMGMPMAKSLLQNHFEITVFDINQDAVAEITRLGAKAAASPAEVARYNRIIITMVKDETQTDRIIFGEQGLWGSLQEGTTLILSSTLNPDYCHNLYQKARERGVRVIDAPVTDPSGPAHVLGCLTIMVGGDKEAVDEVWPVFQAMGKNIYYLGRIGNGQICKLVNQINAFNIGVVTRESLNMGVKAGLDLKTMVEALSTGLGSTRGLQNMAEMLQSRQSAAGKFSLQKPKAPPQGKRGIRDQVLALELAQAVGAKMPVAQFINQLEDESLYADYTRALSEYLS